MRAISKLRQSGVQRDHALLNRAEFQNADGVWLACSLLWPTNASPLVTTVSARKSLGDLPVHFLNALRKLDGSEKPTRSQESVGFEKMTADVPLHRIGDGDDLKGAALLFCSPAGTHITGQILAVDGGIMAM